MEVTPVIGIAGMKWSYWLGTPRISNTGCANVGAPLAVW